MTEYIGYSCDPLTKNILTVKFNSDEDLSNTNKNLYISDYSVIMTEDFEGNITENVYDTNSIKNNIYVYLDKNNLCMEFFEKIRPDLYNKHTGYIKLYYDYGGLKCEYFLNNGMKEGEYYDYAYNSTTLEKNIITKINYVNNKHHGIMYAIIWEYFVKHVCVKYTITCVYDMDNLIKYEINVDKNDAYSIIYELIDITGYQYDYKTNTSKYSYLNSDYNFKWIMVNDDIVSYDFKFTDVFFNNLIKRLSAGRNIL